MLKLATTPLASLSTTSTLGDPLYTDWDTLFGITYDKANTAIQTNWSSLEMQNTGTFKFMGQEGTYTLDAKFGPWQITIGGDGKNIDLSCPISSGTYAVKLGNYSNSTDLGSEAVVKIEVGLEWVPDPSQKFVSLSSSDVTNIVNALISAVTSNPPTSQVPPQLVTDLKAQNIILPDNATVAALSTPQPNVAWKISAPHGLALYAIFYSTDKEGHPFLNVYQLGDSWLGQLRVQIAEADGTSPVTVKSIKNDPTGGDTTFAAAVDACFNANIGVFNHIFATLNLSIVLAQDNQWKWLTPTSTSYAVLDGTQLSNSTFGVLTMTEGRSSPDTQQIPAGLIPSNDGPSNVSSDAAFLISSKPFMTEMILPVVMQIFDSTNASDFNLTNETLQWTNENDVTWGFFILSDTPTITFNDLNQGIKYTDVKETVSQLDNQQSAGSVEVYWGTDATPYLSNALNVSDTSQVTILVQGSEWRVVDASNANTQFAIKLEPDPTNSTNNVLNVYPATQLHIPAKQFKISLNQAQLDVSFINLTYAANPNYNVSINYQESWKLGLKEVACKDAKGNPSIAILNQL